MEQKFKTIDLIIEKYNLDNIVNKYKKYEILQSFCNKIRSNNKISFAMPLGLGIVYNSECFSENDLNSIAKDFNIKKIIRGNIKSKPSKISINFKLLGQDFKDKTKDIIASVKSGNFVIEEGYINCSGINVDKKYFDYKIDNSNIFYYDNNEQIGLELDIEPNKELMFEFIVREIKREISILRKEFGYNIDDIVVVNCRCNNSEFEQLFINSNNIKNCIFKFDWFNCEKIKSMLRFEFCNQEILFDFYIQ